MLADLDEALFSIASVVNFTATVSGDWQAACLNLEAVLLPESGNGWISQVEAALDQIPAIREARQVGRLEVRISGKTYAPAQAGSLAKRKIIDLRSGIHA